MVLIYVPFQVEINRKDPFNNGRCSQSTLLDDANLYKQRFNVGYSATVSRKASVFIYFYCYSILVSTRAVIGQFCRPYSTLRPATSR